MHLFEVKLRTGNPIVGYLLDTTKDSLEMLKYEDEKLTFVSISKSIIESVEKIRQLTMSEIIAVEEYTVNHSEKVMMKKQLTELDGKMEVNKDILLKELAKLNVETVRFITFKDIQSKLTGTGYTNLFLLVRMNTIALEGEQEELVFKKSSRFAMESLEAVVSILNTEGLIPEKALVELQTLVVSTTKEEPEKTAKTEETTNSNGKMNILDIQDKLTEQGFRKLHEMQELGLIDIGTDGSIDFGEVSSIPFFGKLLDEKLFSNVDLFVEMLNADPMKMLQSPMMNTGFPVFTSHQPMPPTFNVQGIEEVLKNLPKIMGAFQNTKN